MKAMSITVSMCLQVVFIYQLNFNKIPSAKKYAHCDHKIGSR